MKVTIDAGGREVTIEVADTNVSPADIAAKALELWQATEGAGQGFEGPAFGFSGQAQLHNNRSTYGWASFRHGDRPVVVEN